MNTLLRVALAWLATLLPVAVILGQYQSPPTAPGKPLVLEQFRIAGDGDVFLLPVRFQGKTYPFMLDTGASHNAYDLALRPLLGERIETIQANSAGGPVSMDCFRSPEAFLGKLPVATDAPVVAADMAGLRNVCGEEIAGVLGMSFLKKHIIRIDFDSGTLTFLRAVGPEPGEAVTLHEEDGAAYVEGRIAGGGADQRFMIDTGSDSSSLKADVFETLLKKGALRTGSVSLLQSAAGTTATRTGRASALTVGPFEHRAIVFTSPCTRNLLGLQYLLRYTVTFDFPAGKMYLKKGERFGSPDSDDASGLHFWRPDGRTVIARVDPESPGARAGIRPGDVLLDIDGHDAGRGRLHPLRLLLCAEGKTVPVKIRRDGEERTVSLRLDKRTDEGAK
jgi:hypothetical protein